MPAQQNDDISTLQRFRLSPLYLLLLKKLGKIKPMVSSRIPIRANLMERAKTWAQNRAEAGDAFSNALIAKLIQVGLNRAIVDVMSEDGQNVTLFMSDRLGRLSREMPNLLSEIAEIELVQKPDETDNGTFVFEVQAKEGIDFEDYIQKLLAKDVKVESVHDPVFIPRL